MVDTDGSSVATSPVRDLGTRSAKADLVVVANRLPVRHVSVDGTDAWQPSPGGLVSALTAVLQNRNGLWIGWPGTSEYDAPPTDYEGIRLLAVDVTAEEYEDFYLGFSNATLWPLYHDAIRAPAFHRHWWQAYSQVNMRF
ncbi:MAG TPA: trehalose-6-phosphate synthase, partial [Acidimicrobiales bacterium]|nr:trehalose-6-phosphate synthase [Acidimicrobiales bacterium]